MNKSHCLKCLKFEAAEDEDAFAGVYESPYFKLAFVLSLLICGICIFGFGFIIWFERSGQAGHMRTLKNQLVSFIMDQVIFPIAFHKLQLICRFYVFQGLMYFVCLILDTTRALFGPLNKHVCVVNSFLKGFLTMNVSMLSLTTTITKFVYIFIFKAIPIVDDDFLATYIYMMINSVTLMVQFCRMSLPGRPILNTVCDAYHIPIHQKKNPNFFSCTFRFCVPENTTRVG